jgi:hypothetical protein
MRLLAALLMIIAAAHAAGQPGWDPAAAYITPGQDEPGYRSWYLADASRGPSVTQFHAYLAGQQVAGIIPTWQLLRTATDWSKCGAEPFEVPPPELWPHLVGTLRYIRAHVIPVIGPVEAVSAYRNPALNACANGAPDSAHREDYALDLVPRRPTTREGLIRAMCAIHEWRGRGYEAGLGFYRGLRFHIDSKSFRSWSSGDVPCVAPEPSKISPQPLVLQNSNTTSRR